MADTEADRALIGSCTALALGMLAAGVHLPVSYALVKWSCAAHQRTVLVTLAVMAFLVTLGATWLAWSAHASLKARADAQGAGPADRSLFVAQMAVGIDVMLALFIAASTIGPLAISPCA
jgi:cytochrome bd-type quinol oxidase subunit 2